MKKLILHFLLALALFSSVVVLQTGCGTIGATQAGVHSARAIAFLTMRDSFALAKDTFTAFADECARGNPKALSQQASIDAKWDHYRAVVLAATKGLTANWQPTTPDEQAALVAELVQLIEALGIHRKV